MAKLHIPSESGGLAGLMLVRPDYQGQYKVLKVSQNGTECRIYPALDPNTGQALPMRYGEAEFHDWICSEYYAIVFKGGCEGKERLTLFVEIEGDEGKHESQRRGIAVWNRLWQTVHAGVERQTHPHWYHLIKGDNMSVALGSKYACRPHKVSLFYGGCTYQGTDRGPMRNISRQTPHGQCLFYMTSAAQKGLGQLLFQKNQNAEQFGDDWDKVFVYNKILDPNTGPLVTFKKPGLALGGHAMQQQQPVTFGQSQPGGMLAQGQSGSEIVRTLEVTVDKQPVPVPLSHIQNVVRPWRDVLQIWKNEKELVCALEQGFPDEVIIEAFRYTPQFLSERLLEMMKRMDSDRASGRAPQQAQTAMSPPQTVPTQGPSFGGFAAPAPQPAAPAAPAQPDGIPFDADPPKQTPSPAPVAFTAPEPAPEAAPAAPAVDMTQAVPQQTPTGGTPDDMNEMMAAMQRAADLAKKEVSGQ